MIEILKRVCDICGCDCGNSLTRYKLKRENYFSGWDKIDICNKCYSNLKYLKREIDAEDRIAKHCLKRCEELCTNGDENPNADLICDYYMLGVQDAVNCLLKNKLKEMKKVR